MILKLRPLLYSRTVPREIHFTDMASQGTKAVKGKRLPWNMQETLALAKAVVCVSTNSINGAQMKRAQYERRMRAEMLRDPGKPVLGDNNNGGPRDARRWEGRTAVACSKQWMKVKSRYTSLHGCSKRLSSRSWTGHPSPQDMKSAVVALYNKNPFSTIQAILLDPQHYNSPVFLFMECYDFLEANSTLIQVKEKVDLNTSFLKLVMMSKRTMARECVSKILTGRRNGTLKAIGKRSSVPTRGPSERRQRRGKGQQTLAHSMKPRPAWRHHPQE
jgi:hypothetical protein